MIALPIRLPTWILCPLLFFSLAGLGITPAATGQAWTQPNGHTYLKLSQGRSTASELFDFQGDLGPYNPAVEGDAFFDRSFYLYGEVGLTDNLTFLALLPFKRITVEDPAFDDDMSKTETVGSVLLGLRFNLKKPFGLDPASQHTFATNIIASLPTGYDRNFSPSVGAGQVDVQGTLHYGVSLYPFPGYAQAGLGYRVRSSIYALSNAVPCDDDAQTDCTLDTRPDYSDELLFSGEFGFSPRPWSLVQLFAQGVWSNIPPDVNFDPRNPISTRQRYIKGGPGLTLYPLPHLGLSVQAFFTPFGRNTIHSTDLFFGLEYQFDVF